MKRVMIVLISVVMLFTACINTSDNSTPVQIAPEEEFDGVLFGMTMEEVINTIDRQPDLDYGKDISYKNETFLNIDCDHIQYCFEDDKLKRIDIWYKYSEKDAEEQRPLDFLSIREDLLKRYPGESTVYSEKIQDFSIYTYNRKVNVFYLRESICVTIESVENTETPDTPEP